MTKYQKFEDRISNVKLLALDVDGVLTDGNLYYSENGEFMKVFNVKDGMGLKILQDKGIIVAVITARKSKIVDIRMKELGIKYVYQGVEDKLALLEGLSEQFMFYWDNIAYMGDDINDLPILKKAGFATCPSDAMPDLLTCCHYVTKKTAGKGAVRELADLILKNLNR